MCRFQEYFSQRAALWGVALLMSLLLGAPSSAAAFALSGVDARVGVMDPDGVDGTVAVGGGLNFQQAGSHVHLMPNVLFWNESGLSDVNTNFDASYHFEPAGRVSPYVGGGLGVHFYSADSRPDPGTDLGANLFGGVSLPMRGASLYLEGRTALTDRSEFGLMTGATFYLGR
jgi:hypothetical protein